MNMAASKGGRRALWTAFWLLVVFLYAPLLILAVFSFNDREFVSFPWQGFTTRWYSQFMQNPQILGALRTSAFIAAIASAITTALAIPASIAMARRRFFAKGVVSGFLLAPLVVPLVVLGTAMLILFNYMGVPFGPVTLTIAHVIIALPFAILTMVPRLHRIPEALEEAARDLGGNWWTTFRSITFPLLAPAVVSAYLISFVISFDEIVLASFLAGQTTTFPIYVYSQLRLPRQLPQVPAVAVVVLTVSTIVVVAAELLRVRTDRALGGEAAEVFDEPEPKLAPGVAGTKG
jgi:spermidine/putrescine transport system permease protein